MKSIKLFFLLFVVSITVAAQNYTFPELRGEYLGQNPPGLQPELFAPGIISNGLANRDVAISPDGKEMFFSLHTPDFSYATIIHTKQVNGTWTKPEVAPFATNPRFIYLEPAFSPDGEKLFFMSTMSDDGSYEPKDEDIWVVDKTNGEWSKPYNLGTPNGLDSEFYPSLTKDGTLYYTWAKRGDRINYIYRSKFIDGKYTTPEKLPDQVNCGANRFNAFIDPDEKFLVLSVVGMEDGLGGADYYIVYRNEDDTWQEPLNLGPKINSQTGDGWSFNISPDKKYIFYVVSRGLAKENLPKKLSIEFFHKLTQMTGNGNPDIYWIDAKILDEIKSK